MTNTINGRTPAEIKKGMECCQTIVSCTICPYHDVGGTATECMQALFKDAFELNSKLEYTLLGVMHSVDKWLDVEPYDFDKDDGTVAATRAATAREVALKAIEKARKDLVNAKKDNGENKNA